MPPPQATATSLILTGMVFYKAGETACLEEEAKIAADDPEAAARIREADQSALTVVSSKVILRFGIRAVGNTKLL